MKKINIMIVSLFVVLFVFVGCSNIDKSIQINSFEDCLKAGGYIAESYPRQCFIEDKTFEEIIKRPVQEETVTESFTGTVKKINNGKDGSSIVLENDNGEKIETVISIPNLGLESSFDFSDIELGNILRVSGTTFDMQGTKHLTAKYAITMYSKIEKEECLSSGGTYNPEGMLQAYMCNLPAKDVGKSCKDSSECEGLCLQDGKCSIDTVNFGCIDILEKGELVTICID